MINTLLDVCLRRGRTVILLLVFILITGGVSYFSIPKEAQPDVTVPYVYVRMHHEGISPEDAERMLIRPMEKELRGIDGLKEMTASAYEGGANVMLEFEAGMDIDPALNDVREKVDIAKAELPQETDEPLVSEINLALQPVIVISLSGDIPERQLVTVAKDLRDELEGISEILEVEIKGDREEVVELVMDPDKFEAYQLRLDEISNAARRNNVLIAAGIMDNGAGRIPVKVPGLFESPEDLFYLPVKTDGDTVISTQDIATVRPTFKDPTSFSRLNGKPAITLRVKKRVGENVISAVEKVRSRVAEMKSNWPSAMQIEFSQDQSEDIRTLLRDLQNNVISAIVLVMIVCIGALGFRSGLLVGIAIPGSFLAGVMVLYMGGLTVNIVVLFSLILAVGMLVDGAIVVVELADRKMNEGLPRFKAYLVASQRMAMPIISSTATTLAAFIPLLFWPGIVGEFMKFLPITLVATLTASLAMALIFVPTVGTLVGKPGPASHETMRSLAAAEGGDLSDMRGFTGWYVRRMRALLKYPWRIFATALILFVGVQFLYGKWGKGLEFFPEVDPEFASILVRMRGNLSIHEMDDQVKEVEDRIRKVEGIDTMTAQTGTSFQGDGITEDTHGLIQLEFKDWRERPSGNDILREIELRTEGLNGIEVNEMSAVGNEEVRLRVQTEFPMGASRIQESLQELEDRLRLVARIDSMDRIDGTRVLRLDEPVLLAELNIHLKEDGDESWRKVLEDSQWEEAGFQFREAEEDPARILVSTKESLGLVDAYTHVASLEEALIAEKSVRTVSRISGTQLWEKGNAPWTIGEIGLFFAEDAGAEDRRADKILSDLQPLLRGVPGVIIEQKAIEAGPPTGKDIQIELSSRQPEILESAVKRVRSHLEEVEGLKDIDDTRPVPGVEWEVNIDRVAASRYGADISLVGSYVQFVTNGLLLGTYRPDGADDEVDIRVRFPRTNRNLMQIENLRVTTPKGTVPIKNFATWGPAPQTGQLERVDGRRYYMVTANVDDNYLTDTKVRELEEWRQEINLPEGLMVRFRGENEEQEEAMAFLSKAFFVAIFVMGIILVTQFNSFFQAFLVLTAVIFSTIGVFLGLLITGQPFGVVMNGIGVIALAGIVVNNNIVLIDTFDYHRRAGTEVMEAVLRTGAQRLRPVLLTTITTVLGLMPMVLKLNIDFTRMEITYNAPSTQWWVQLSTSVAFGLIFATFLTLVLTPAMLVLGDNIHRSMQRFKKRAVIPTASSESPFYVVSNTFYRSPFRNPIIESKGAVLHLVERDDEERGWIFGQAPDGREGWVPLKWLKVEGNQGTLTRDYNATELDFEAHERFKVTYVESGWFWAVAEDGREGWIPQKAVDVVT